MRPVSGGTVDGKTRTRFVNFPPLRTTSFGLRALHSVECAQKKSWGKLQVLTRMVVSEASKRCPIDDLSGTRLAHVGEGGVLRQFHNSCSSRFVVVVVDSLLLARVQLLRRNQTAPLDVSTQRAGRARRRLSRHCHKTCGSGAPHWSPWTWRKICCLNSYVDFSYKLKAGCSAPMTASGPGQDLRVCRRTPQASMRASLT